MKTTSLQWGLYIFGLAMLIILNLQSNTNYALKTGNGSVQIRRSVKNGATLPVGA